MIFLFILLLENYFLSNQYQNKITLEDECLPKPTQNFRDLSSLSTSQESSSQVYGCMQAHNSHIQLISCQLLISFCNFTGNYYDSYGGAIHLNMKSYDPNWDPGNYIVNSIFKKCHSNKGGAIYILVNRELEICKFYILNDTFEDNYVGEHSFGGAIDFSGQYLNISGCSFINNDGRYGTYSDADTEEMSFFIEDNLFIQSNNCLDEAMIYVKTTIKDVYYINFNKNKINVTNSYKDMYIFRIPENVNANNYKFVLSENLISPFSDKIVYNGGYRNTTDEIIDLIS